MPVRKVLAKNSPYYTPPVADAAFVVSVKAGSTITASVTLKDATGVVLARAANVRWYLSSDAAGLVYATAASGGVAVGANGGVKQTVTGIAGNLITTAAGLVDLAVTDAGPRNLYLNIVLPDGTIKTSGVLAF